VSDKDKDREKKELEAVKKAADRAWKIHQARKKAEKNGKAPKK